MIGFSKEIKILMLQALLTKLQGPDRYFILLSREYQDATFPLDDAFWQNWDGTRGSNHTTSSMAINTSGDVPFLYNTSDLVFYSDGSELDVGYIAIGQDTGSDFIFDMLHPLVSNYEWEGVDYVVPAGDFRIYI